MTIDNVRLGRLDFLRVEERGQALPHLRLVIPQNLSRTRKRRDCGGFDEALKVDCKIVWLGAKCAKSIDHAARGSPAKLHDAIDVRITLEQRTPTRFYGP